MARKKSTKAARTGARSEARRAGKQTSARPGKARPPVTALTPRELTALTHRELTDRALVPAALALGLTAVANSKVRPHTSAFFHQGTGRAHRRRAGGRDRRCPGADATPTATAQPAISAARGVTERVSGLAPGHPAPVIGAWRAGAPPPFVRDSNRSILIQGAGWDVPKASRRVDRQAHTHLLPEV
jgi:hypothetical protein